MNEYTALTNIMAPDTSVFGYRPGDAVSAGVVESWGLVVGDDVCEGDLPEGEVPEPVLKRPEDYAVRAEWEAWAIANGTDPDAVPGMTIEDLQAVQAEAPAEAPAEAADPNRPADSANKAAWVDYAVSRGMDEAEANASTKAQLQAYEPTPGDTVAVAATEANQG